MITAIKEIGEFVSKDFDISDDLCFIKTLVRKNDYKYFNYIIKVNFDTKNKKVNFENLGEATPAKLEKYLWIGHFVSGARSKKIYLVTSNFQNINKIIEQFTLSNGTKKFKSLHIKLEDIKKSKISIPINNYKALYLLSYNNDILSLEEEYKCIICSELINKYFNTRKDICSICNNKDIVTSKIYVFKYYNTDKIGFSSKFKGDFERNFLICKTCLKKSLIGKNYIESNLKSSIGLLNFFIIPHLFYINNIDKSMDIDMYINPIKNVFNPSTNLDSIVNYEYRLIQFNKFTANNVYFILNFLFYIINQKQFAILKLIKDILPSRITTINKKMIDINNNDLLNINCKISLRLLYNLLPLKITKVKLGKNKVEYKYYIDLLEAILKGNMVDYHKIIKKLSRGIKIVYYNQNSNYSISKAFNKNKIEYYILSCNKFLLFLYKINCIKKENAMNQEQMDVINILVDKINVITKSITNQKEDEKKEKLGFIKAKYERLKNYLIQFNDIINNKQKIALIMLGYILNDIAYTQEKSGLKNKPILNKINYNGMKIKDVIYLSNIIYDKLIKYKDKKNRQLLDRNNIFLYIKDNLLIQNIENWDLSSEENVFYLMSGYSLGASYYYKSKDIIEESENLFDMEDYDNSNEDNE